ncbi:CCAAT enhancer binding protein [Plakobranchus ocellatus]|uniref:CCAAT enhancer binding protein n=1 Tax=Plakobranchus ocellatus TaxID=259542 RepID=A0AAV4AYW5_9GAST|nr:CCAAT enhancer binding protein [Plakobranchus ocellatus]
MDSLQLSELQTFLNSNKGELNSSKKLFVDSVGCTQLDILDPILERTLDLREFFCPDIVANNISTPISSDQLGVSQSLPQVVLDATAVVHEGKYLGEGSSSGIPRPVVNFLEPNHSPVGSDVTSYYSEDSADGTNCPMPEFNQLTSPVADAPSTSFQWPSCSNVKLEQNPQQQHHHHQHSQHLHHHQQLSQQQHFQFPSSSSHIDRRLFGAHPADSNFKSDEFNMPSACHSTHTSSASDSAAASSFPFVTSPSASLPSPTSTVYSASSPGTPGPSGPTRGRRPHGCTAPYSTKSSRRRQVEKGTEEYVEKRARNNVAVRKSRAKAKQKQRETESRVKSLLEQNDQLQKKVDSLTKELNVLKGLFVNIGASIPDEFLKMMSDS